MNASFEQPPSSPPSWPRSRRSRRGRVDHDFWREHVTAGAFALGGVGRAARTVARERTMPNGVRRAKFGWVKSSHSGKPVNPTINQVSQARMVRPASEWTAETPIVPLRPASELLSGDGRSATGRGLHHLGASRQSAAIGRQKISGSGSMRSAESGGGRGVPLRAAGGRRSLARARILQRWAGVLERQYQPANGRVQSALVERAGDRDLCALPEPGGAGAPSGRSPLMEAGAAC